MRKNYFNSNACLWVRKREAAVRVLCSPRWARRCFNSVRCKPQTLPTHTHVRGDGYHCCTGMGDSAPRCEVASVVHSARSRLARPPRVWRLACSIHSPTPSRLCLRLRRRQFKLPLTAGHSAAGYWPSRHPCIGLNHLSLPKYPGLLGRRCQPPRAGLGVPRHFVIFDLSRLLSTCQVRPMQSVW